MTQHFLLPFAAEHRQGHERNHADTTFEIRDHDGVGGGVEDGSIPFLAFPQRLVGPLAPGDVAVAGTPAKPGAVRAKHTLTTVTYPTHITVAGYDSELDFHQSRIAVSRKHLAHMPLISNLVVGVYDAGQEARIAEELPGRVSGDAQAGRRHIAHLSRGRYPILPIEGEVRNRAVLFLALAQCRLGPPLLQSNRQAGRGPFHQGNLFRCESARARVVELQQAERPAGTAQGNQRHGFKSLPVAAVARVRLAVGFGSRCQ